MKSVITSRWVRSILGMVITATFLLLLFHDLNIEKLAVAFTAISIPSLLIALGFLAAGYTIRIVRWWLMMRLLEPALSLKACAWPFLVSVAVNNILPFRAGDALRVFGFRKRLRTPAMRILGTLIIERLLDLMILLGFFFIGLLGVPEGQFPDAFVNSAIWVAAFGSLMVLILLLFSKRLKFLFRWIANWQIFRAYGWTEHLIQHADNLFDTLDLLRTRQLAGQLIGLSIITWSFEGAVFVAVAHGLNTVTSFIGPCFSLATGTLATLLPSSPGYFGTFDYFTMDGMVAYGTQREVATVFALTVHFVLWLPLTLAGMMYYLSPSFRAVRREQTENLS